nr:3-ketodihydrosphingosine reductase tsc10 [Quercus suber]
MAIGLYWAVAASCAFVAWLALDIMGLFSGSNHFKTIVITGGSQGMGRGLGKLLAQKGAHVVIVARNKKKLDEAVQYIAAAAKDPQTQRFHCISADVTKAEENVRIISEVTAWNHGNPPDIVWANAGAAEPQLFVDTPIDVLRSQMDINYFAAAYLAQATLKSWLQPASASTTKASSPSQTVLPRHFIMTSSSVCFVGVGGYAPYAPAKAAMRSLADTLRSEVNLYNGARRSDSATKPAADIKIHCVLPGTIKSRGLEHEEETKHPVTRILEEGDPVQTEDEVAAASVRGLEKGGFLITTQFLGHAMRAGALGGSPRNSRFIDTLFAWVVNLAWLFIGPDMESKVFKYGKDHGAGLAQL